MNYLLDKLQSLFWLSLALFYRLFSKIHKKQILFSSYYGKNYSCNPRAITEHLIGNHNGEYTLYWILNHGADASSVPSEVKVVRPNTFEYIKVLYSSEYLITNVRQFLLRSYWIKKKGQKYVMTWHSSMGLKCIEGDASVESLGAPYVRAAKFDSKQCDLILSGSRARSEVIKHAFWYDGEILEKGTPRNDIFFNDVSAHNASDKVRKFYGIPNDALIVLYAPTFRESDSLDFYRIEWDKTIKLFEDKFGKECYALIRLHPNLIKKGIDPQSLVDSNNAYDATRYSDMQELLVASDVLITDYSSSMFDFSYIRKPVFLHATDYSTYDRNTYFDISNMPFPFSSTYDEFAENIQNFNIQTYLNRLDVFLNKEIGSYEEGEANISVYDWMQKHSIK